MTTPPDDDTTPTPDQARAAVEAELASLRHLCWALEQVDKALGLAPTPRTPETGTPPASPTISHD